MTRTICVNRKLFNKGLGYGCWTAITLTLLVFTSASLIETDISYTKESNGHRNSYLYVDSVLFKGEEDMYYKDGPFSIHLKNAILILMTGINFAVLIYAWYDKQKTFKLSWCEKG